MRTRYIRKQQGKFLSKRVNIDNVDELFYKNKGKIMLMNLASLLKVYVDILFFFKKKLVIYKLIHSIK